HSKVALGEVSRCVIVDRAHNEGFIKLGRPSKQCLRTRFRVRSHSLVTTTCCFKKTSGDVRIRLHCTRVSNDHRCVPIWNACLVVCERQNYHIVTLSLSPQRIPTAKHPGDIKAPLLEPCKIIDVPDIDEIDLIRITTSARHQL